MMTLRERERLDFVIGFHPPTPCHLQRRTHDVQRRKIRGADLCTWGYYCTQLFGGLPIRPIFSGVARTAYLPDM